MRLLIYCKPSRCLVSFCTLAVLALAAASPVPAQGVVRASENIRGQSNSWKCESGLSRSKGLPASAVLLF
jgi:hypothetical protein